MVALEGLMGTSRHASRARVGQYPSCQDCWPADPGLNRPRRCGAAASGGGLALPAQLRGTLTRFLPRVCAVSIFGGFGLRAVPSARLLPDPDPGFGWVFTVLINLFLKVRCLFLILSLLIASPILFAIVLVHFWALYKMLPDRAG
jgi:hypothetical protein